MRTSHEVYINLPVMPATFHLKMICQNQKCRVKSTEILIRYSFSLISIPITYHLNYLETPNLCICKIFLLIAFSSKSAPEVIKLKGLFDDSTYNFVSVTSELHN